MTAMRVGIINRFTQKPYHVGRELVKLGVDWQPIQYGDLHLIVGEPHIGDRHLTTFNLTGVLWRISENELPAALPLLTAIEKHVPMINTATAIMIAADKWATYRHLHAAGINTVETVYVPGGQHPIPPTWATAAAADFDYTQTVIKPTHGAGGRGVRLLDTTLAAPSPTPTILQPLARIPGAEHVRVQVCGEEIVGAYRRIPAPGRLANNLEQGGMAAHVTLDAKTMTLAQSATRALGLHIAGIDIIPGRTPAGPYVLEVNSTPGIQGLLDLGIAADRAIAATVIHAFGT